MKQPYADGSPPWEPVALAAMLLAIHCIYVCSSDGMVSTNDGSHFATTRALAEYGTLRLQDGVVFALNDVAIHNGERYANKPPGTAILAWPFYWLSRAVPEMLTDQPHPADERWYDTMHKLAGLCHHDIERDDFVQTYDSARAAHHATALLASLAGVLALWMTYRLARGLGVSARASMLTMLCLGLGTIHWRYSTAIFTHAISAAMLCVALERLFSGRAHRSVTSALLWGLLVGSNVVVEYQAMLSIPVLLGAWLWWTYRDGRRGEILRRGLALVAGIAVPLGLLAWFHAACFGHPLRTAPSASEYFGYAHSAGSMFGGDLGDGMISMLFSTERRGLLAVSPIAAIALVGWSVWPPAHRDRQVVVAGVIVAHCVVLFQVVSPEGGGSYDHRYLVRILPLVFLPMGLAVDRWGTRFAGPMRRAYLGLVAICLGISIARTFLMMTNFLKHNDLRAALEENVSGRWDRLAVMVESAFPSLTHGSLLLVSLGVYFLAAVTAWWVLGDRLPRAPGPRGEAMPAAEIDSSDFQPEKGSDPLTFIPTPTTDNHNPRGQTPFQEE